MSRTTLRAALAALLLIPAAWAAEPTLDDEQAVVTNFVTPHTDWAPNWPAEPLRVLFFSDYRGTQAREIVELMQRFNIEADMALHSRIVDTTTEQWHGGDEGLARIRRLLDANAYDAFLFNGVKLDGLPTELQYKLLKQVAEGAGLVMVGGDDERVFKRPIERAPGDPDAALFAIREGRGAKLPAAPVVDYRFGWETDYDYWQERLGRTLLWAAEALPPQQLAIALPDEAIARADLPATLGRVTPAAVNRARLRRADGRTLDVAVDGGQVRLPKLIAGDWHLDAWAGDAWATAPFTVTAARTPTLALDRDWGEIGEGISGTVTLDGEPAANERVVVELRDRRGRVLAATRPEAPRDGGVPFSFGIPAHYPMLVEVRAVVLDDAGEVADATAFFNVTKRHRGRFNVLVWDVPGGPTAPFAEAALADLGMTLQLKGGAPPPFVAAYETAYVPYTTRIMADVDAEGQIKPVPWNKEPDIDAYVQDIVDKYEEARQHGVFVYSLGDETVTSGTDLSASDLAAYREWLADQYGDIAALNESWGTDFASFDAIELLDQNEPRELAAKQPGSYPRWYDRQAWANESFVRLNRRFGEAYKRLDPEAKTGFEGAGRLDRGEDYQGIVGTNEFWAPYPGPGDHVVRGLAPREFIRANWMGYRKEADPLIWKYWRMILNESDSVWWWRWDGVGRFIGLLRPDLSVFEPVRELMEDTRITREGLGDLLLRYEAQHDGVALLYSMPSVFATQVEEGPSFGNYEGSHAAWHQALFNLGLNFDYISTDDLRAGRLDPQTTKVLLLPRAEALSDADAAAIAAFAEAGGTVIADVRPGRFDEHVKPRASGALDELFGIDSSDAAKATADATATINLDPPQVGHPQRHWSFDGVLADPGVKVTGGMAMGGAGDAPLWITHSFGRGRGVLLNWSMNTFPRPRSAAAPPEAAATLGMILADAGVQPAIELAPKSNPELPLGDTRIVRWTDGEYELVGIMLEPGSQGQLMGMEQREGSESREVTVTLPAERSVYDLRHGIPLGNQRSFPVRLRAGRVQFYALTPAPVAPLDLEAVPARVRRGQAAELRLAAPEAAGDRAALVTATLPDGRPADWIREVVVIPRGRAAAVALPTALNDPAGAWTVTAKELFTGRELPVSLTVEE